MTILETKQVCMYFGGLKAVEQVDMQVENGVIGPNGAGKTTFFNVCSGNYAATHGDVFLKGEAITGIRPEQIAAKGMARTFQNIKLFNNMTVLDNIKIGFHMHTKTQLWDAIFHTRAYRADEESVERQGMELLEMVGLSEYALTKAGNLAYGTQRKVEIARALAMKPDILLLDEPAAGMNPNETMQLLSFVRMLNGMGYTIVVIEHDMKFIMNLCNRIMVLNYGKKLFSGTPEEVKNNDEVIEAYFGKPIAV